MFSMACDNIVNSNLKNSFSVIRIEKGTRPTFLNAPHSKDFHFLNNYVHGNTNKVLTYILNQFNIRGYNPDLWLSEHLTQVEIAKALGIGVNTVARAIDDLVTAGFIFVKKQIKKKKGYTNSYKVNYEYIEGLYTKNIEPTKMVDSKIEPKPVEKPRISSVSYEKIKNIEPTKMVDNKELKNNNSNCNCTSDSIDDTVTVTVSTFLNENNEKTKATDELVTHSSSDHTTLVVRKNEKNKKPISPNEVDDDAKALYDNKFMTCSNKYYYNKNLQILQALKEKSCLQFLESVANYSLKQAESNKNIRNVFLYFVKVAEKNISLGVVTSEEFTELNKPKEQLEARANDVKQDLKQDVKPSPHELELIDRYAHDATSLARDFGRGLITFVDYNYISNYRRNGGN